MEQHPLPRKKKTRKIKGLKGQIYTGTKHLDLHLWSRKSSPRKKKKKTLRRHQGSNGCRCEIISIFMSRFSGTTSEQLPHSTATRERVWSFGWHARGVKKTEETAVPNQENEKKLKEEKCYIGWVRNDFSQVSATANILMSSRLPGPVLGIWFQILTRDVRSRVHWRLNLSIYNAQFSKTALMFAINVSSVHNWCSSE